LSTDSDGILVRAARRERYLVIAALGFVAVAGLWTTLRTGDWLMDPSAPPAGSMAFLVLLFVMWWSMMMAMMLPTAATAILGFGAIARKNPAAGPLPVFAAGYAAMWSAFSAAAVALQDLTRTVVPLTGMMAVISHGIGASLLIAAGLYQFTPLKGACLRHCQSPFFWLAHHWRNGAAGAFRMGLAHGLYCIGCCWVLMLLLFYGGVMELGWIVGLALYVGAEKLAPAALRLDRIAGTALVLWGLWTLKAALS
jgi:predicted metal-binding membrane protein